MTQPLQHNLKALPMAPAESVHDSARILLVKQAVTKVTAQDCLQSQTVIDQFCELYRYWICSTKNNHITGLDDFPTMAYSNGTSEAFDKFYLQHRGRRFRCLRGEYLYHQLAWNLHGFDWSYLDDIDIAENDALVVSLPFADTGNTHSLWCQDLLDNCLKKRVPVLVDCAFFGICANIDFNFNHPAITDICFSLSKTAPVNLLRIGLRFTRSGFDDSLQVYQRAQYVNKLGAAVGIEILNSFDADETYNMWRSQQLDFCSIMNLSASDTVIFGIDTHHLYDEYNRGSVDTNRICFSKYLACGALP